MSNLTSKPMDNGKIIGDGHKQRGGAPRIGFLTPRGIERAFVVLLYMTMLALVLLSVTGTFYGLQYQEAPLTTPLQMYHDVVNRPNVLALAVVIQIVLTLAQYGARQMATHDRRWWILYLVALAVSVYYNVQAYWLPLNVLVSWPVAAGLIIAGDVAPEYLAVRRN